MARIRTIKPEFPQSESMGRISRDARLLFIMLWTIVDDAGRTRAAPRMLASLLYPYDDDAKTWMGRWLAELEGEGCVRLYEHNGNAYLQIEKWLSHQKIDRPSGSRLPEPPEKDREPSRALDADLVPRTVEGTLDQLPAGAGDVTVENKSDEGFETFWKAFAPPKNSKKPDALKAWHATAKTRPPPEDLLRAVDAYNSWLADESRKQKREYPKQHPATWLRGEVWQNYLSEAIDPTIIAANLDRADKLMRRGKYAPVMQ